MEKKLTDKEWNNKIEEYVIGVMLLLAGVFLIYYLASLYVENQKQNMIEFENKYKPICEKYDKLWLESGGTFRSRCFDNDNGVLTEYNIIQKGEEFYLQKRSK